ncbi:MAG: PEP-CTERM system TPR-repeat protein PrsT [Candidatus Polarisedimenticolaceae bacterium]|nr:PEP-CTERM system TPR-repeat protein PrsT [Candidatus Polarisedimenticolaceae bacterium]
MKKHYLFGALLAFMLIGCDAAIDEISNTDYLARAEKYLDDGELKSASIELKNALRKAPDNPQARWLLGRLYLEVRNPQGAEKELNKAREFGVNDAAVLPLLLKSLLMQGKYSNLLEQDISKVQDAEIKAELLASRSMAYYFQKETEKANREIDIALEQFPDSIYANTAKARLTAAEGNLDEAYEYLDKALARKSDYKPAWSLQGDLLNSENEQKKAVDAYANAVKGDYFNVLDLQKKALLLIRLKRYEEAQESVDVLKALVPNYPGTRYAQGLLYFFNDMLNKAESELELALTINNSNVQPLFFLGATQYKLGKFDKAKNSLTNFIVAVPQYPPARKMLAQIKLKEGAYNEAEKLIRPLIAHEPKDVAALNILANALFGQEKTGEGVQLLEKIVAIQPESPQAQMRLGVGLLEYGEKTGGIKHLKMAVKLDPEFLQAEILLILNHIKEKNHGEAIKEAEALAIKQPDNLVVHNMLGTAYLVNEQLDKATLSFQKAKALKPGDPKANHNLAMIALQKKKVSKARDYYNDVLRQHPGHLFTFLNIARLEAQQDDFAAMKTVLEEAIESNPDAIEPRVLLVRQYLREGKVQRARAALGNVIEKHRNSPMALTVLGEIQLASREYQDAKISFQNLIELNPKASKSHFLLAKAYSGLNDHEKYKIELEKALAINPDHIQSKIAMTQLQMIEKNFNAAQQNIKALKKQLGDTPEVLNLEGNLLERSGKHEQALGVYQHSFELKPDVQSLIALTRVQWSVGMKDDAISKLKEWNNLHKDSIGTMLNLANKYHELGRLKDAMHQYQQVLDVSKNNVIALNDLAWHLKESDLDKALFFAEKAYSIASDSPSVLDTLSIILLEKGEAVRALRFIDRALVLQPEDPTLAYHRLLILEKSSDKKELKAKLGKLLKKETDFPERADAEQLLKRLMSQ